MANNVSTSSAYTSSTDLFNYLISLLYTYLLSIMFYGLLLVVFSLSNYKRIAKGTTIGSFQPTWVYLLSQGMSII